MKIPLNSVEQPNIDRVTGEIIFSLQKLYRARPEWLRQTVALYQMPSCMRGKIGNRGEPYSRSWVREQTLSDQWGDVHNQAVATPN